MCVVYKGIAYMHAGAEPGVQRNSAEHMPIHTYIHTHKHTIRLNSALEELAHATERAEANESLREEAASKLCSELSMAADEIERLQKELREKADWMPASEVEGAKEELRRAHEQVGFISECELVFEMF